MPAIEHGFEDLIEKRKSLQTERANLEMIRYRNIGSSEVQALDKIVKNLDQQLMVEKAINRHLKQQPEK